jgi:hypothetical protein
MLGYFTPVSFQLSSQNYNTIIPGWYIICPLTRANYFAALQIGKPKFFEQTEHGISKLDFTQSFGVCVQHLIEHESERSCETLCSEQGNLQSSPSIQRSEATLLHLMG